MQIFRYSVTHLQERNTAFINFRKCFWGKIEPPHRVFFYEGNGNVYMSFKDPFHLPMYKVFARRLQCTGRDQTSYKVTIPTQLVKKHNLKEFNIVNLHRLKHHRGMLYRCSFEYEIISKKTANCPYGNIEVLPLIDLLA